MRWYASSIWYMNYEIRIAVCYKYVQIPSLTSSVLLILVLIAPFVYLSCNFILFSNYRCCGLSKKKGWNVQNILIETYQSIFICSLQKSLAAKFKHQIYLTSFSEFAASIM